MPVDGVIIAGESAFYESPVTGESWPVEKGPGQDVFAGTINGTELRTPAGRHGELVLQANGDALRITAAQGNMALAQGQTFTRAAGASCG